MAAEKFIIEIRTKGFKGANKSLERVTKSTRAFSREANRGSGVASTFRRSMSGLRNNLLLVSFAFGTVGLAFKKFVDASSGFEDVKTRLVGLMGSTERAERAFASFNAVAATTPFSLQDVVEAGAQLKAFGADAEDLIKPVADLAAFMGTTATEAANSLGRAFAGGAGEADILRTNGVLNLLKSFKGIDDLSKLTLPEFRQALQETLVAPTVGIEGSTDRMAQTFTGAFSNMSDSVTRLAARIGDVLLPSLKAGVKGLGSFADQANEFSRRMIDGKENFDIFGDSIAKFSVNIERLSIEDLNKELESLKTKMALSKEPVEIMGQSFGVLGPTLKLVEDKSKKLSIGVITLQNSFGNMTGTIEAAEGILIKTNDVLDGVTEAQTEFNHVQFATNVNAEKFNERIKAINDELERRASINPELTAAQTTFNDLLKETDFAQAKEIETLKLLIETHREELGTNEEVTAVLTELTTKYNDLTGATKAAADTAKDNEKAKKDEEQQLYRTAAATTAIASGLRNMMREGASAEDQFKAIVSTFAQLISMGVFSAGGKATGASSLMGSLLSAITGHTGGLIQDAGIQRFASGGMVQGGDNVPILAQSGEFIMQRSAVNSIGLQNLAQMNSGGQSSPALTINIAGDMVGDEDHVRTKVLPAIREELRREANA